MRHQFTNDYSELSDRRILERLLELSDEQNIAYGLDKHSNNAKELIKKVFDLKNADIHFLSGGTQTNMILISYALRPYEGVLSCETGHINVHETAAVEGSGHKVYTVKGTDGKLKPIDVINAVKYNADEHMVKIKMAYVSDSTEIGTIYKFNELKDLYDECKKNDIYLFLDGARLASALTSKENDIKPSDLSKLCDAFYIGGTKNGMLFSEALVLINDELKKDFRYHIKNKGAMLAKGFVPGIMFEEMFKDNLYFDLGKHSNSMADYIKNELINLGYNLGNSPTNQIFVRLNKENALKIIKEFGCEKWIDHGDEMTIRIVTSFKTKMEDCIELIDFIKGLNI